MFSGKIVTDYLSFRQRFFYSRFYGDFGENMEDRWIGKNIDLSLLSQGILEFFKKEKFIVSLQKKEKGYMIVAVPRRSHKIAEKIFVNITGEPGDFSVKFISGTHSRALVRIGTTFSFLGAGFLVLKGLKSQEELEKLEKRFWMYVDRLIWQLSYGESDLSSFS